MFFNIIIYLRALYNNSNNKQIGNLFVCNVE